MVTQQIDLSIEEIDRIAGFLGYGQPSAPVWFIGLEEGLGGMDSGDISKNLKARAKFESTMDLRAAHLNLQEQARPIDIESHPPATQVWQWMAKIMLARQGIENWGDLVSDDQNERSRARDQMKASVEKYIRYQLGRSGGDTFLTELSPIPSSKSSDKSWLTRFEERDPDLKQKLKLRKENLERLLATNSNSLVICYGDAADRAHAFAKFLKIEWQSLPTCPRLHRSSDSKRLLLPFFGNGQMSYAAFVELIRSGLLGKP